jgi:histone-lysine N-methyltransferase SETD8
VTRSVSGKLPLSLKGCENLQNELNLADKDKAATTDLNTKAAPNVESPTSNSNIKQSPPTPHKIIRVKESINPLQKLKSISLTPKKSTKNTKQAKRQPTDVPVTGATPEQSSKGSNNGSKASKLQAAANTSHKVTEYFPIRRSERKPKAEILKQELETIQSYLDTTDDSSLGIEIANIENKGRGIKAVKSFNKGDFVVEYAGDLIDIGTAKDLEVKYSMDASKGCYMYYFKHRGKQYCIDATAESGRYGRLVNHSRVSPNCMTKVVMVKEVPRLMLVAKQNIDTGEEILYDYGDRSKESLKAHPWLAL